jgi:hypothetical protein
MVQIPSPRLFRDTAFLCLFLGVQPGSSSQSSFCNEHDDSAEVVVGKRLVEFKSIRHFTASRACRNPPFFAVARAADVLGGCSRERAHKLAAQDRSCYI